MSFSLFMQIIHNNTQNAIILRSEEAYSLCQDTLAIHGINKGSDLFQIELRECKGFSMGRIVKFVTVAEDYDKLVSILKPRGIKVVRASDFNRLLACGEENVHTVYASLYDDGESECDYKLRVPSDWYEHFRLLRKAVPLLSHSNRCDLACRFGIPVEEMEAEEIQQELEETIGIMQKHALMQHLNDHLAAQGLF